MSTKSSMFSTSAGEHWYYEHADKSYVFDFNDHATQRDEEGLYVTVKNDTPLHREIRKLFTTYDVGDARLTLYDGIYTFYFSPDYTAVKVGFNNYIVVAADGTKLNEHINHVLKVKDKEKQYE